MAQFTGLSLKGNSSAEVTDALVALNRSIEYQMNGNLDSGNIHEIGGWLVGDTELQSTDFNVGMSSVGTTRFWAGGPKDTAPFRVSSDGSIVITNGSISWGTVNAPTAAQTGSKPYDWLPAYGDITGLKPPSDADNTNQAVGQRLTYIDGQGIYTGTLTAQQINAINGITLGANASILWAQLPTLPTAAQVGAKPASYVPSYSEITGSKPPSDANNTYSELLYNSGIKGFVIQTDPADGLQKLFISADYIRAGHIKGDQIDVTTDLFVGKRIQVGASNDTANMKQIQFNTTANISNTGYDMSLSSNKLDFLCSTVTFGQTGTVDFGNATIIGANFTAKFG